MLPYRGKTYSLGTRRIRYGHTALPDGYTFADGNTVSDFYLSNTHRLSFSYGEDYHACEHGEQAFHDLRKMKHYRKKLDLCILDQQKRPIAMAIICMMKVCPIVNSNPWVSFGGNEGRELQRQFYRKPLIEFSRLCKRSIGNSVFKPKFEWR